jgi:hypothetical protein
MAYRFTKRRIGKVKRINGFIEYIFLSTSFLSIRLVVLTLSSSLQLRNQLTQDNLLCLSDPVLRIEEKNKEKQ